MLIQKKRETSNYHFWPIYRNGVEFLVPFIFVIKNEKKMEVHIKSINTKICSKLLMFSSNETVTSSNQQLLVEGDLFRRKMEGSILHFMCYCLTIPAVCPCLSAILHRQLLLICSFNLNTKTTFTILCS